MSFFENLRNNLNSDKLDRKLFELQVGRKMNELQRMQNSLHKEINDFRLEKKESFLELRDASYQVMSKMDVFEDNMLGVAREVSEMRNDVGDFVQETKYQFKDLLQEYQDDKRDTIDFFRKGMHEWEIDRTNTLHAMHDTVKQFELDREKTVGYFNERINSWEENASKSLDLMDRMNQEFSYQKDDALNSMREIGTSSINSLSSMIKDYEVDKQRTLGAFREISNNNLHKMDSMMNDFQVDKANTFRKMDSTVEGMRSSLQEHEHRKAKFWDQMNIKSKEFNHNVDSASSRINSLYSQMSGKLKEGTFSALDKINGASRSLDRREIGLNNKSARLTERENRDKLDLNNMKDKYQSRIDSLLEENKKRSQETYQARLEAEQNMRAVNDRNAYINKQRTRRPSFRYTPD